MHTITARLTQAHDVIGVETLAITPMMVKAPGKWRFNRGVADAAMGELLRQLDYKATWYGATLVRADRFYPSTRTCSTCGTVKANLSLSTRTYTCDTCGTSLDRDLNAAINLARHAHTAATTADHVVSDDADPVAGFDTGGATHKTPPVGAAGKEAGTPSNQPTLVAGSVRRKARHVFHEVSTTS